MSFTQEEAQQALTYAKNGAMFMFRATEKLSNEIVNGGPATEGLVLFVQEMLMTREWINLNNKTVIKYCNKTLDGKNTYVLDNSDIKVIPEPWNLTKIN